MRTRIRFSLRLIHHLLALAAAFLLAATPALADPASRVSTTSGGTDGGFSPAPRGGSILDDVLGGGITPINCPAPSGDPCDPSGPASIGTGSGANLGAGNPIHLASGNKYRRETDLPALPGVMGLEIVRHYNSTLADPDRPMGILGRGWRLSYETELAVFDKAIHILQADGSRVFFARTGKSTLIAQDPAYGQLQVRGVATRPEGFEWHWPDGRRLEFDARGRLLQIIAPDGHFVSLLWAPGDSLMRVTDPQGRSLEFEYAPRDSSGFRGVVAIGSPLGRFALTHQNDRAAPGLSNLTAVTDPEGRVRRYHYGADEHELAPQLPHHLTGISVDTETGPVRIATYDYDARGRATLSVRGEPLRTDVAGHTVPGTGIEQVSVDYAERGVTVITNSLGERTTYRHAVINSGFRLLEAIGPGCASCGPSNRRYAYDKLGRMVEEIELGADGTPITATLFKYDARGRALSRAQRHYLDGAPGKPQAIARYDYASDHPRPTLIVRPSVVPGREHQVRIEYNEHGQILRVTEAGFSPLDEAGEVATPQAATPIERSTAYTYARINGRSLLTEIDGPLANGPNADPSDSDITRFQWDGRGDFPMQLSAPGGRSTRAEHDHAGRVRASTSSDGVRQITRTVQLNTWGTLTQAQITASADNIPTLTRLHTFTYDRLDRLVSARGADGISVTFEHGADRTLASTVKPISKLVDRYDNEGRLIARTAHEPDGEPAFASLNLWDAQGQRVASLDEQGLVNAYGTASGWTGGVIFAADGAPLLHGVDLTGLHQLSADGGMRTLRMDGGAWMLQDAAGRAHVLLKDDFGRTVLEVAPDEGRLSYTYGDFTVHKRQIGLQGEQIVETLRFDPAGRLVERDRAACTETLHYRGDLLERLQGCANAHVFARDAFGQIITHAQRIEADAGALSFTHRYAYAPADGRLLARSLPDGQRLHYHYDPHTAQALHIARERGWLNALRKYAEGLADWLHASLPESSTEEALITDIAHTALGQSPSYRHANGLSTRLVASRGGRIQSMSVTAKDSDVAARLELHYTHDRGGRISATVNNGVATAYHYDAVGRLTEARADSAETALLQAGYTPMGARRTQRATPRDGFGRQRVLDDLRLVYDDAHRLAEVQRGQALVARYTYDALGNRISKTVDGQTTHFLYDLQHRLVAETDAHGRILTQYLYAGHRPHTLLRAAPGASQTRAHYAIHADPRGLALAITDEQANIVWQQAFGPFGEPLAGEAANDPDFHYPLRLAGQYFDAETGLHYNIHRYFDPRAGRYLTPDPLGLTDSDNRYAYAGNNPMGQIDPLGLFGIDEPFFWTSNLSRPLKPTDEGGHLDILMVAFTQYQMANGYRFSQTIIDQIIRNNYHADSLGSLINLGGGQGNIYNHWDNPNNGPMCQDLFCNELMPHYTTTNWMTPALAQLNQLRGNYAVVGGSVSGMTMYNLRTILSSFGQNSHAIADFYAHTNWIDGFDRGGTVCNDLGSTGFVSTPPVRPDRRYVQQDPTDPFSKNYRVYEIGYVPLGLSQNTLWDESIVEGLFSGTIKEFAEPINCPLMQYGKPGDIECRTDPTTHGYWHKDKDDGPGGSAVYDGPPMFGWEVKKYKGEPPKDKNDVELTFGTQWYADLGVAETELKIGDRIYVQVEIKNKYQLAFHLAVEHTKLEIARLYEAADGVMVGGTPLREVYKMDAAELFNARIGYQGTNSKQ